jgi:hypothetical protein
MKLAALALAALSVVANAQGAKIIGTIPNQDNGHITFTSVKGSCEDNRLLAYIRAQGGQIEATGCYILVDDQFFVLWATGEVFTYSLDSITFTKEFLNSVKDKDAI